MNWIRHSHLIGNDLILPVVGQVICLSLKLKPPVFTIDNRFVPSGNIFSGSGKTFHHPGCAIGTDGSLASEFKGNNHISDNPNQTIYVNIRSFLRLLIMQNKGFYINLVVCEMNGQFNRPFIEGKLIIIGEVNIYFPFRYVNDYLTVCPCRLTISHIILQVKIPHSH